MKIKVLIVTFIVILIAALILVTMHFPYTSSYVLKCGDGGTTVVNKTKQNDKYYIQLDDNTELSCTEQQYNYIKHNNNFYMRYEVLFYNKHKGRVVEVTDKDII